MNVLGFSGLATSIAFKRREFPGLSEREYNIAQGLDSAAALVRNGEIVAAAAEERFTRQKATNVFPSQAMEFCVRHDGINISDADLIAHGFAYQPFREIIGTDDYGRRQYAEVFAPEIQKRLLAEKFGDLDWDKKFIAVPHHLAHAASTFYPSGFSDALILVSDGMGEVSSMTVFAGRGTEITELAKVSAFHSLGALYGAFSLYLGFYMNSDEYKVMGLAPYGNSRGFLDQIMEFISLRDDGTYTIPLFAQNKTLLERETHRGVLGILAQKFGPAREPETEITQTHKDIAAALQAALQMTQLHVLRHFKRQTGLKKLCLSGGVALNCSANGAIRRSDLFEEVFVQPGAGDDGTAVGAALYAERLHDKNFKPCRITVPLWGPEFSSEAIAAAIAGREDIQPVATSSFEALCKDVALRINRGEIIGWFQGRMEFGPRALGNRSILADPRDGGMREKINALVKKREGFRPFAPVVAREKAAEIFEIRPGDEETFSHMLYVTYVRGPYRDKLPATTHVDGSARAQTVSEQQNPRLWRLLQAFAELSGLPVLLNTSFNVRGQPIVCTPAEAIDTFLAAGLDALVVGDTLLVPQKAAKRSEFDTQLSRTELEEAAARHEDFWVNRLCDLQPVSLPYARVSGPVHSNNGDPRNSEFRMQLSGLEKTNAALNHETVLSAFAAFIARLTGIESFDVLLGDSKLTRQIGDARDSFATWLPFKIGVSPEQSGADLTSAIRPELANWSDHSTYRLDVAKRHPALRSGAQLNDGLASLPLAVRFSSRAEECELAPGSELTLNILGHGGDVVWHFNSSTFNDETVCSIAGHFAHFIHELVSHPKKAVRTICLLNEEEWSKAIEEWNATECEFAKVLMHEPFETHAKNTPEKVALIYKEEQLTYGELNARAEAVADELRKAGVRPDEAIAVCADVSTAMMAALLGVLKAGGAYLPLDPGFPKDRLAFMLEDSQARVLLTLRELKSSLPPTTAQVICLDEVLERAPSNNGNGSNGKSPKAASPAVQNLAYVIYTSGSTGKPKGVMIQHGNVANFYHAMDQVLGTEPSVWLAVTSISFDISILELFWTLSRGYKVVLQPKAGSKPRKPLQSATAEKKNLGFSLFYFAADEAADSKEKYRLLLEGARFADANGFEAVWTPERHFHSFGGLYPNPSVTSAAVAASTKHIKIRAGSVVAPLHDPIRIAEEWSIVDNISNGRTGISFASGWQVNDFVLAPDNHALRKERMLQSLDDVRRLWRGEALVRKTPNGKEVPIRILPRPVQPELPIWITASGNPDTFQLAGELGANVLTHLLGQNLTELRKKIEIYRNAWEKAGHQGCGHVTLMLHTYVHENAEVARETVRGPFTAYLRTSADLIRNDPWAFSTFKRPASLQARDRDLKNAPLSEEELDAMAKHAFERHFETSGLFGTPAHCLKLLEQFQEIGVQEIACLIDFGLPQETVLSGLRDLAKVKQNVAAGALETIVRGRDIIAPGGSSGTDTVIPSDSSSRHLEEAELESDHSIPAQILRHGVTHMQCTPSLAMMLLEDPQAMEALGGLKKLLLGGEALPLSLVQKLDIPAEILNMYGPTETTIWSAAQQINRTESRVPIGRPIANTQFYIVDRDLQPVPIGVPGELLIGGSGVVRGYWRRPELTAERFVQNPFSKEPEKRLYRTGDLVRHLPDGRIEFLGRLDHQVKLRGYRIELAEVEMALRQHESLKDAAAIVREDVPGDKRLVAYIIPQFGHTLDNRELRQFAASRLPDYMVPSALVQIAAFPLTPNGKLDRKALPRPESAAEAPPSEPMNLTESKVAEVMCGVLGVKQIGMRHDFFELGGNSLLATQLIARLRQAFRWELPLRLAFEFPTVESLAQAISEKSLKLPELEANADDAAPSEQGVASVPLSFAQQRIWFLHQLEPGPHYNDHFDLRVRGPLQAHVLERALNEIVRRHQTLRSVFKDNDGKPQLEIVPQLHVTMPVIDLADIPQQDRESEATKLAVQDCQKPFDLENGPLFRATMVRLSADDHLLILTFDHIVVDGWSHGVFLSELTALYGCFIDGKPSLLPELAMQYSDYAEWQLQQFADGALTPQVEFWRKQLHGVPPILRLRTDYPRPPVQSYKGAREFFKLSKELMGRVAAVGRSARGTSYMVLLSAFEVMLARQSAQLDFVIGTPVANRNRADVEGLIGSFMNTLALRSDLPGAKTLAELLGRVRHRVLDALAQQELPFEKLVAELQPERALGYGPFFQVMFILQNTPAPVSTAADVSFRHFDMDGGSSKMDLTLNLEETDNGAEGWLEYSTDLFRSETVKAMVREYLTLLEEFCASPEAPISLSKSVPAAKPGRSEDLLPEHLPSSRGIVPAEFNWNAATPKSGSGTPETLSQIQSDLAVIWSKVLNTPAVGMDDNLFDLGGHSLLVTQIISRIRKTWNVNVPIHHFFDDPTVRVISGLVEKELKKKPVGTAK